MYLPARDKLGIDSYLENCWPSTHNIIFHVFFRGCASWLQLGWKIAIKSRKNKIHTIITGLEISSEISVKILAAIDRRVLTLRCGKEALQMA